MRKINTSVVFLVGLVLLLTRSIDGYNVKLQEPKDVKIATFNLSFDRKTFENLVAEMLIEPEEQNELVMDYLNGILTVF